MPRLFIVTALLVGFGAQGLVAQKRPNRLTIPPNGQTQMVKGQVPAQQKVVYSFTARSGWFLTVNVRSDKPALRYKVEAPGRRGAPVELFSSKSAHEAYRGQLFSTGDHVITVSLPEGNRRLGERASFDLMVSLSPRGSGSGIGRPPGAGHLPSRPPGGDDWARVRMIAQPHGPLLKRMQRAPDQVRREAMTATLYVLGPDLAGMVTEASAQYDRMENPSQVTVTATERGIMDDDLLGVRHAVTLNRNSRGQLQISSYLRGELRRRDLR